MHPKRGPKTTRLRVLSLFTFPVETQLEHTSWESRASCFLVWNSNFLSIGLCELAGGFVPRLNATAMECDAENRRDFCPVERRNSLASAVSRALIAPRYSLSSLPFAVLLRTAFRRFPRPADRRLLAPLVAKSRSSPNERVCASWQGQGGARHRNGRRMPPPCPPVVTFWIVLRRQTPAV
jgi:hypothetical protein